MKYLGFLLVLMLSVQIQRMHATNSENPPSCPMPAPSWISATNITASTITVTWEDVSGATGYKLSRYDVTHSVALPDVYVSEPGYTSGPHDPGTTISFTVQSTACYPSGPYGETIVGEYTTSVIIVDDIVYFQAPGTPGGNTQVFPGGHVDVGMIDADKNVPTVGVLKVKMVYQQYYAEFLLWSSCSVSGNNASHVMYWNRNSWPGGVSLIENHVNENPLSPIFSINFKINSQPFFTLNNSLFTQGVNGNPNMMGIQIINDKNVTILYNRISGTEHNPCYPDPPHYGSSGGGNGEIEMKESAQDRNELHVPDDTGSLHVSPNPFSSDLYSTYILEEESAVTLSLFDCTGRELKTVQFTDQKPGIYHTNIKTGDLPAGMYFLSLQTNRGKWTKVLVKEN